MTQNEAEVSAQGSDIANTADLENNYPGIKDRICDEQGEIRRFVNIYLNDEDIRFLQGQSTSLADETKSQLSQYRVAAKASTVCPFTYSPKR